MSGPGAKATPDEREGYHRSPSTCGGSSPYVEGGPRVGGLNVQPLEDEDARLEELRGLLGTPLDPADDPGLGDPEGLEELVAELLDHPPFDPIPPAILTSKILGDASPSAERRVAPSSSDARADVVASLDRRLSLVEQELARSIAGVTRGLVAVDRRLAELDRARAELGPCPKCSAAEKGAAA